MGQNHILYHPSYKPIARRSGAILITFLHFFIKCATMRQFEMYPIPLEKNRVINVIMKTLKCFTRAFITFFAIITSCSHMLTFLPYFIKIP